MSINKTFKNYVSALIEQCLDANLELYIDGRLTAAERCVLTTKWLGEAWVRVKKQKHLIKHSLQKQHVRERGYPY